MGKNRNQIVSSTIDSLQFYLGAKKEVSEILCELREKKTEYEKEAEELDDVEYPLLQLKRSIEKRIEYAHDQVNKNKRLYHAKMTDSGKDRDRKSQQLLEYTAVGIILSVIFLVGLLHFPIAQGILIGTVFPTILGLITNLGYEVKFDNDDARIKAEHNIAEQALGKKITCLEESLALIQTKNYERLKTEEQSRNSNLERLTFLSGVIDNLNKEIKSKSADIAPLNDLIQEVITEYKNSGVKDKEADGLVKKAESDLPPVDTSSAKLELK